MAESVLLLNGPNLDMLGVREPDVYGTETLDALETMALQYANQRGVLLTCVQSNSEAELIEHIHRAPGFYAGIVYNPGAHAHYSYALRDAVAAIDVPVVEVHISDVDAREAFRARSVIAPECVAVVKGMGLQGYCRAIDILCDGRPLARLGEGYERRFAAGQAVLVAGCESGGGAGAPGATGARGALEALEPPAAAASDANAPTALPPAVSAAPVASAPEDFTAPFAQDIAAADAGVQSRERLERVRALCAQLGLDALLVRDTSNIAWLTAFDGVFDEERAHALLVTADVAQLHSDSRYSNALRTAARRIGSPISVSDERVSHAKFAKAALASAPAAQPQPQLADAPAPAHVSVQGAFCGKLGFEDSITYTEFAKTVEEFGAASLLATTDVITGLRAVKSVAELTRLRAAQAVTDAAFRHIVGFMRPGMTEREVQLELEDYMLRHGGEGLAFSSIVATGANGADPHAIPGGTRLEVGQCVVMDFGAKAYGYCSDMTRMVFLGSPDAKMAMAWEVLRRANETVEAQLGPGMTGKEAHELAERVLAEGGFAGKMGHGLGHGVGIDVHELPVLNTRNEQPLVAGNVVTVEPGIYLPGEFGMRLEDCGVVTEGGYEVFSQLGHDMVVL